MLNLTLEDDPLPDLLPLLYSAISTGVGTVIATNDPEKLRQQLYALRRKNPDLKRLSFIISPDNPTSELWIVKREEHSDG